MKIAIIGSKEFDSLEYHLADTLQNVMLHDVFHIDIKDVIKIPFKYNYYAQKFIPRYDEYVFEKIADQVIAQQPDLVIGVYRFIHPNCIAKIKKNLRGVKTVQINPDTINTFEYQQIFATDYDAYFTKDTFIADFMRDKMNLNAFYLPEALNPRVHKPVEEDITTLQNRINIEVAGFGTMYPYRAKFFSEIIKQGIKVDLFGVADRRFPKKEISESFRKEYITGERKAEVSRGAKIVLNNFFYGEVNSANVKFFEIYGVGGFQLCDEKKLLREYSAVDIEKFTFKNIDEAAEKIKYYLTHPEERIAIANQQMKHFHAHHTYENRLTELLNKI